MTTTHTAQSLESALRQAFSQRSAETLADLYAEDAEIEMVDAQNQPKSPRRLKGRDAIRAQMEDVFGRDLTHEIDTLAITDDALGYSVRCTYADGTRVVLAATAQLADGKIVRELDVQAWDG